MAKVLSSVNELNQGQNKRKVLQILQMSADESGIIGGDNMVKPGDKALKGKGKQSKTSEKIKETEKENGVAIRRSKRTAATCSSVKYVESPEESKTIKPKAAKSEPKTTKSVKNATKSKKTVKSKKGSTAVKKTEQAILNQTKLSFSPVAVNTEVKENKPELKLDNPEKCVVATNLTEDSGCDASGGTPDKCPLNSTVISSDVNVPISVDSEISMITADNPPLSYWKSLANQRQIALEAALHQNELLYDQLSVLEAENSQLKQLVREAENLAQVVKSIIE